MGASASGSGNIHRPNQSELRRNNTWIYTGEATFTYFKYAPRPDESLLSILFSQRPKINLT